VRVLQQDGFIEAIVQHGALMRGAPVQDLNVPRGYAQDGK